jgi:lipoyl(octanoyl) transferase
LNVNTDLSYFDLIVPCGLKNVEMTSMEQILGKEVSMDDVKKSIVKSFGRIFEQDVTKVCLEEIT